MSDQLFAENIIDHYLVHQPSHKIVIGIIRQRRANQLVLSRRFCSCGRSYRHDWQTDGLRFDDWNAETFVFTCIHVHVTLTEQPVQFVVRDMAEPVYVPRHAEPVGKSEQLFRIATQLFISRANDPQLHVAREQADIRIQHTQQMPMPFMWGSSSHKQEIRALSNTVVGTVTNG